MNPGPQVPAAVVDKWNASGAAGRPENEELPGVVSIGHASLERMQTRPQSPPASTAATRSADERIDAAYMAVLSRKPTAREKGLSTVEDLIYALINTRQFIFNQ